MGWIKNTALAAGMLLATVPAHAQHYADSLQTRLAQAKEQQEKHFGITHETTPEIAAGMPEIFPAYKRRKWSGMYSPDSDSIYMGRAFLNELTYGRRFENPQEELARTIRHELGHNLANDAAQALGHESWPNLKKRFPDINNTYQALLAPDSTRARLYATRIIAEGIAVYYEIPDQIVVQAPTVQWDSTTIPTNWQKYVGGYQAVKPILDKHARRGLEYLVTHPPRLQSLAEMPAYTARALKELDESAATRKPTTKY